MERYRTNGFFSPSGRCSLWWNNYNGAKRPTPVYTPVPDCFGTVVKMWDTVTPGFHKRSKAGEVFSNRMSKISDTHAFGSTGPVFYARVNGLDCYGELLGGPWTDAPDVYTPTVYGRIPPDLSPLYREVQTSALAKVKRPEYSGLVALGELRETLGYLRNPLKTGLKLAKVLDGKARRVIKENGVTSMTQDPVKWRLAYRELQNLYMEFRYGVRPLVHDVTTLAEAIRDRRTHPLRETFRAKAGREYTDTWTIHQGPAGGITYDTTFNYKREVTCRAGLLYEYSHGIETSDSFGFTLDQVPATVWELTPLSFIVDWFGNVGQFIQALVPVSGMNRLSEWTSVRIEEETTAIHRNWRHPDPSWSTKVDGGGVDTFRRVTIFRIPTVGIGSLVFKNSVLEDLWGDKLKLLDLVTIIQQKLRLPFLPNPGGHLNIGEVRRWRGGLD